MGITSIIQIMFNILKVYLKTFTILVLKIVTLFKDNSLILTKVSRITNKKDKECSLIISNKEVRIKFRNNKVSIVLILTIFML